MLIHPQGINVSLTLKDAPPSQLLLAPLLLLLQRMRDVTSIEQMINDVFHLDCVHTHDIVLQWISNGFWVTIIDQLQTMYLPVALNFLYPLITLSMAFIRSFSVMALRRSRIANIPASVQTERSSAPVVLGHSLPRSSYLMPFSTDMCLAWMRKMWTLPSRSGRLNSIFLSILPGRMSAGSRVSGLLVAISTLMFPLDSKPSIWLTISNIVLCTSWSPPEPSSNLAPPIASTSSKKMIQAFLVLAIWKISLTILAPSPTYFWTSSDPITLMKQASVLLATALAVNVFPVPGGPQSKTPFGGSIPKSMNFSGVKSGISTTSLNFSNCSLHPPISLQVTSGLSSTVIMVTVASILAGRGIWIWYFCLSTPTLMPSSTSVGDNLSLSLTTNLAICLRWITYFFSVPSQMILLHLATCKGCSVARLASSARFHCAGSERPVSSSLIPVSLLIFSTISRFSYSNFLMDSAQGPSPYALKRFISASSSGMYFFYFFSQAIQIFFKQQMIFKTSNNRNVRNEGWGWKVGLGNWGWDFGVGVEEDAKMIGIARMINKIGERMIILFIIMGGAMLCCDKNNEQPRKDQEPIKTTNERPESRERAVKKVGKSQEELRDQELRKQRNAELEKTALLEKEKTRYEKQLKLLESQNQKRQQQADKLAKIVMQYQLKIKDLEGKQKSIEDKVQQQKKQEKLAQERLRQQYEKKISELDAEKTKKINQYQAELAVKHKQYEEIQQKTQETQEQARTIALKLKQEHEQSLKKIQQQHNAILRTLQREVQERRHSNHTKQQQLQQLRYNGLFQNDIFITHEHYKQSLASSIQQTYNNRILKTRLLYKFDASNKINFHRVIDHIPHIVVIIKLNNQHFMAGYSQGAFAPNMVSDKDALLFSLNNHKTFRLGENNRRAITYDEYYLIFGNSELRLRSQQNKVFSNFALSTGYFSCQGQTVNTLLGSGNQREVQLLFYEIYQLIFQRQ